jgi:hypothetical protein
VRQGRRMVNNQRASLAGRKVEGQFIAPAQKAYRTSQ